MSLLEVESGCNGKYEMNVVIEIPMQAAPVKYEVDKKTGALTVDRFMSTAMFYPANYGYVPQTLSLDGDPVDVLVITPVPVIHGAVIRARAIGMLDMTDEAGVDSKILAVPVDKLSQVYSKITSYTDVPQILLSSIEHFFMHYKDLEAGKWVKIDGWRDSDAASQELTGSVKRYQEALAK